MKDYLLKRTAVMAIILGALCACQPVMTLAEDMPEEEESFVVMDEGGDLEAAESEELFAGSDSYDDDALFVDMDASDEAASSGIMVEGSAESQDTDSALFAAEGDTQPVFSFTQETCSLVAPNTATINVTGDTGSAVSWSVSDPKVIKITSNTTLKASVKAVGEGTANLIATSEDGQQAICTFTVTLPDFDFPETLLLEINRTDSFYFSSGLGLTSRTSSNSDIVSCTGYSSSVYLEAKGLGTATVTLADSFGRVKTCKVTVKEHVLCFEKPEVTVSLDGSLTVDIPKGTAISVESSDEAIAKAKLKYSDVEVSGIALGTTTITAKDKYGEVATLVVHVEYPKFALYSDEVTIAGGYDNKYWVRAAQGSIVSVESQNEEIVKYKYDYGNYIYGVGLGETDVVFKDKYGQECTLHVIVTKPDFTTDLEEIKHKASKEKPSVTVKANNDITKIEIADPSIVKAALEEPTNLTLTALHVGNTEVTIYDNFGNSKTLPVEITGSMYFDKEKVTLTGADCENGGIRPGYASIYYFDDVVSLTSSNRKIVDVKLYYKKGEKCWYIDPENVGTATIYARDCFGGVAEMSVTVSVSYMNAVIRDSANTKVDYCLYGKGRITGRTLPGAVVSTKISGKTYKAVVGGSGYFSIKIPVAKIGTVYRLTFSYRKGSYSRNLKVLPCGSFKWPYIYSSKTSVKVTAYNVHAGDKLVLKIGKKKYTKKIKKNASKKTIKFKIKKTSPGKTVTLKLYNKYGQLLDEDDDIIYYAKNIKMGMTKKQVEYLVYWGYPDDTSKSSGGWTYWYYDDGSCVGFKNGRVRYYYY